MQHDCMSMTIEAESNQDNAGNWKLSWCDESNGAFQASKAVIVEGPQAKPYRAIEATVKLAHASKYATAVLPNAKVCTHKLPSLQQKSMHTVVWESAAGSYVIMIV